MQIKSIRGRYFAILRRPDGRPHRIRLGTRDEKEAHLIAAQGKLQEMEHAAMAGGAALEAAIKFAGIASATVSDAVEEYLEDLRLAGRAPHTVRMYQIFLDAWIKRFGVEHKMLNEITAAHIDPFVNTTEEISYSTRRYRLTVLKIFFDAQIKKSRLIHNPCSPVGVRRHGLSQEQLMKKKTHAFTEEEYQKLLAASEHMDLFWYFMLVFGRDAALRPVDIASLEVVNVEEGKIRLVMSKTGREITLPITPRMQWVLDSRDPKDGKVFFPDYKRAIRMGGGLIPAQFRRLANRAGVERGSMRSLRKMGAMQEKADVTRELTELIEREAIRRTAEKLGHASSDTTKEYYL